MLVYRNYPFPEKAELMFISTGLTAPQDSDINCDKLNEIGAKIYPSIIKTYTSAKVPRKEKTVTLATFHSILKIDNEVVNIDPLIPFSRIILLDERGEETTPCFEYELTNYLFTLFKDGMMRNCNKASLCSFLMEGITNANLPTEIVQVNNGEALLCQIKSFLCTKFSDIYKLYEKHWHSKYGYCDVVSDCYGNGPSAKDMQHTNRSGTGLPDITFKSDEKCVKSQDDFLNNQNNKARFAAGLRNYLF